MSQFTPDWKLTVEGVDYTNITIANLSHSSGRRNIYSQPYPSYISCTIVALNNQTLNFDINDGIALQIKDSTNTYVSLFGGNITDLSVEVGATGAAGTEIRYNIVALGALSQLQKTITNGVLSQDFDGNQILDLLDDLLTNAWNEVPAGETWQGYDPTTTWANAENVGLGEIDTPGLYTMENRGSNSDTIYNIASLIANSAFGVLYEDNQGRVSYADADHRQNYLAINGYIELDASHAIGKGLKTTTKSGDIRNDIYINYGNNFNSQATASDATSIATYGYKAETINSVLHDSGDAQDVADRYIAQRAFPQPIFDTITFPITNSEIDDADRDALLGVFIGMPVNLINLPDQISNGQFEGYVEGWSWSVSFNQLYLTLTLSPTAYSQVAMKWFTVPATEAWNTIDPTLQWQYATIVA
jgi:hypothetical protein